MSLTSAETSLAPVAPRFKLASAWHLLPWAIALVFYFSAGGYLSVGTHALIMILFALSLDLALGQAGIITLGHAAFFGFGAYATGIFAAHVSNDALLGLAVATVLTGIFGVLVGMLILHTSGVTLMMLTLAISALLAEFANQAHGLTGGDDGLQVVRMAPLFGVFRFDLWGHTAYLYALAILLLWSLVAWRIMRSPFGRSLDGIRQNPRRMRAIGTPVWWRLVVAYGLSTAMAGTAGALEAQTTRAVGLGALSVLASGTVLVMLILGGTRRYYGAFLGAAVYVIVQNIAAQIDPFRWMFVIGIMLMAVVLFLDNGLMGVADAVRRLLHGPHQRSDRP